MSRWALRPYGRSVIQPSYSHNEATVVLEDPMYLCPEYGSHEFEDSRRGVRFCIACGVPKRRLIEITSAAPDTVAIFGLKEPKEDGSKYDERAVPYYGYFLVVQEEGHQERVVHPMVHSDDHGQLVRAYDVPGFIGAWVRSAVPKDIEQRAANCFKKQKTVTAPF